MEVEMVTTHRSNNTGLITDIMVIMVINNLNNKIHTASNKIDNIIKTQTHLLNETSFNYKMN